MLNALSWPLGARYKWDRLKFMQIPVKPTVFLSIKKSGQFLKWTVLVEKTCALEQQPT